MVGVTDKIAGVVYPPRERLEHYVSTGVLGETSLGQALVEALPRYGDKIAINGPDGPISYAQLDDDTNRFAAALLAMGLKPLDRVTFQLVNSQELLVALIACWKADLIPVATLAAHRKTEIGYLSRHAGAKAHFIGIEDRFDFPAFAEDIRRQVPSMEHIVVVRGRGPDHLSHMADLIASQDSEAARAIVAGLERDPYQVTVFQLSGGTTSVPKIIPRFGNEYLLNCVAVGAKLEMTGDDTIFVQLQLMHNAGTICAIPALLLGGTVIASSAMDPLTMLGLLKDHRPTIFFAMSAALARMKAVNITQLVDLSATRLVISPNAARQTEEILGVTGIHIFGMTEGVCTFGQASDPDEARYNTIGTPICAADEMRVVDPDTGQDLPPGEVGELVIRGPYTFHGYFDAEDRNAEVFTADGYYRTGDQMSVRVIEGRKYYAFEGRLKDLVSRGGEKINCEEVEMAARHHDGIADIAVVAMPDPELDERACAFIIPTGPEAAPDVAALAQFLVARGLAKFKCPERIELVAEFPTTDSGKLSKPKLKAQIIEILKREAAANSEQGDDPCQTKSA